MWRGRRAVWQLIYRSQSLVLRKGVPDGIVEGVAQGWLMLRVKMIAARGFEYCGQRKRK
jgi:hypothetical protein